MVRSNSSSSIQSQCLDGRIAQLGFNNDASDLEDGECAANEPEDVVMTEAELLTEE